MADSDQGNTVYCLYVKDVCKTKNANIVSFDFGKFTHSGTGPIDYADELEKKYPFIMIQNREAIEKSIGVYPYGAVVKKPSSTFPYVGAKLRIVPCGDISYLPDNLMESLRTNGYLETDGQIAIDACIIGDVYTFGESDGT